MDAYQLGVKHATKLHLVATACALYDEFDESPERIVNILEYIKQRYEGMDTGHLNADDLIDYVENDIGLKIVDI